ncbi:MAG TPA: RNA polymerase sigma factor [Solirubrobacteraceae bacterium]|nr:RNA polymerase sigma factor [Solirubrobacteraceae bacterium]
MSLPPFQTVLEEHRDDVLRFLIASIGRQEADDVFQETFLAALRAYPRLTHTDNLRGWLLKIASRKAIDAHRVRKRAPVPAEHVDPGTAPPDGGPPDEALWQAVRALPDRQRTAVVLRFTFDLAYREMGDVMGSSEEAARRNVFEGLRKLREEYR